ncbi:MAG: type II toxin-antitoxin system VapC family toxin [Acidobacteriota bacterium]
MNSDLLFDTHSFIWWADASKKLSPDALAALEDENNRLFLSDVSIWEMQIKVQLGKMKLKLPLPDLIESQKTNNDVEILHITTEYILELDKLPFHHKDPFDRLLIAQSIFENFTIITVDSEFSAYPAKLLW